MPPKVVITGMGIVSSIGMSVEENFHSLTNYKSGISTIENIDTLHKNNIKVGEIKLTNRQLAQKLGVAENNAYSRTSLLGILAIKEALKQAQIPEKEIPNLGFINASSVGGMDMTERYFYQYENDPSIRRYITTHNIGEVTHQIADYFSLKSIVTGVSTACSSSANAIIIALNLIRTGRAKCLIAGGVDSLSKFTINGFNSLMILSDSACKPFDSQRKGLNLGEAGAFLMLETEENARKHNRTILAEISGWGNANDAYHQTASSENGEGAFLAMQKALQVAELHPTDIDYVNAHGTATLNNDLSESKALIRIFGESQTPDFSSTKAFTGHTLAAASSVEAVFSVLALQHEVIFPNLNYDSSMEEVSIRPQTRVKHKKIKHVLSNSFGFGGNCSTLIFSKP
ncbi:beta-ketoacyl synthase [Capnocytophaga sp.]|uniref:beta-ketoacyl-[acyl-carrier-protein] synthase family protein n=1 Tax=Capnocytophaga sp. TaxID=44737 RepID=UPI0026DD5008|nr:beta-ketoacyl-[acyl-carrier-protein] synthase family protein [Capnocytophaga sp.]MDO5105325.1 beta-ketoacyl-[acyl-carrier-protein] synthase family protein [Capnocytophaga sp.]